MCALVELIDRVASEKGYSPVPAKVKALIYRNQSSGYTARISLDEAEMKQKEGELRRYLDKKFL